MTESRIRLLPETAQEARGAHMPVARALRWRSPFDGDDSCQPAVSVFVTHAAYVRFCAHAGSDLDNEVGGALVGHWRADHHTGEQFIVIDAILRAQHTRHGSAYLTFTQDTLVALNAELEERYPTKQMVGWFHTHPRMGVFLSRYDTWLHDSFFHEPWQVALVIEPHSSAGGFFIRQTDGTLDPHRYFGFYELTYPVKASGVNWRNLQPEEEYEMWGGIEENE